MASKVPDYFTAAPHGAHGCACPCSSCARTEETRRFVSAPDPCADGVGQIPIGDGQYQCSISVRGQPAVDRARLQAHRVGQRPYRVYLVWQQRDRDLNWQLHHRRELMPVRVRTLESLDIVASNWGEDIVGGIILDEISPAQVTEDTLRGYIDDIDWVSESTGREFFYEVVLRPRCGDQLSSRTRRFYQASEPSFAPGRFEFSIAVAHQHIARSRDGVDQTIGTRNGDGRPLTAFPSGPRLVT